MWVKITHQTSVASRNNCEKKKVKYTIESSMSIELMLLPQQLLNHSNSDKKKLTIPKDICVLESNIFFYFLDLNIKRERKSNWFKRKNEEKKRRRAHMSYEKKCNNIRRFQKKGTGMDFGDSGQSSQTGLSSLYIFLVR